MVPGPRNDMVEDGFQSPSGIERFRNTRDADENGEDELGFSPLRGSSGSGTGGMNIRTAQPGWVSVPFGDRAVPDLAAADRRSLASGKFQSPSGIERFRNRSWPGFSSSRGFAFQSPSGIERFRNPSTATR